MSIYLNISNWNDFSPETCQTHPNMTIELNHGIEKVNLDQDFCMKFITELFARLMFNGPTTPTTQEVTKDQFYVTEPTSVIRNCTIEDTETEHLLKGVIIFLTMVILILAIVIILLLFTMKFRRSTSVVTIPYSYDEANVVQEATEDASKQSKNRRVSFKRQDTTPLLSV